MNDLISIIVPVYNVEKYLPRCVKSLINQTYENIEIILINDGSPDNCPQICENYARNFKNIKLIHQENLGLSAARNAGIDIANGEFLTFVDSDDYIHKNFLEILKNHIDENSVLLSMSSYLKVNDLTSYLGEINTKNTQLKVYNDAQAMEMLINDQSTCTAWGKLYQKDLFKDIRYPLNKLMEDMFVIPELFKNAKLIAIDNQPLYFYNQEGVSITRSDFSYRKMDLIEATKLWKNQTELNYPFLVEKATMHYYATILNILQPLSNMNDKFGILKYQFYRKEVLTNYKQIIKSKYTTRNNKIKILLLKLNLYKLFVKTYSKKYKTK